MPKLYFKYGPMAAGKSLELLKTADNYERKGRQVLLLVPYGCGRDGDDVISSRVGLKRKAIPLHINEDSEYFSPEEPEEIFLQNRFASVVLVDEAQFLPREHVESLSVIVDRYRVPVICFGLRTDFRGELFEGSAALLALADVIEEIRAVCQYCDKKATMTLRIVDGRPTKEGDQIQIGDAEYISVCRYHYRGAFMRHDLETLLSQITPDNLHDECL